MAASIFVKTDRPRLTFLAAMSERRSCVVVLGEVARSPRSVNHARSLARLGPVRLLGYAPAPELPSNVQFCALTPYPPRLPRRLPPSLTYLLKSIWQALSLLLVLCCERCDVLLCQNPPAIPALAVCWLYCLVTRAKFIIDWHNYGHTIMALAAGPQSLIVRLATWIEYYFGRKADANFCVSLSMKNDLLQNHNIQCKLLYDCPPKYFRPITNAERCSFLTKLSAEYPEFAIESVNLSENLTDREKKLQSEIDGEYEKPIKRQGILFSSTSWTADEDFMILLNALEDYDKTAIGDQTYPELLCVITGKGPLKDYYINLIDSKDLRKVTVITPWLEQSDYPLMVASSDLGVCLHTSSSGLDLPMKIVDMFGSGLPVCAYKYPCLRELVKEGENGYMFEDSKELSSHIKTWFENFPNNRTQNEIASTFRQNLKSFQDLRWDTNWDNRAKPYFM